MGIDLWVPKVNVETRQYESTLYRDVECLESIKLAPLEFSNQDTQQTDQYVHTIDVDQQDQTQHVEVSLLKINPRTSQTEEILNTDKIQLQTNFVSSSVIQLDAFQLQAYCAVSCVILVDCTDLKSDEQTLWLNIQRAISGQFYELKWPFPLLQFQDGKGAILYIQGFIDALKQERKVISLGQLPQLNSTDVIQLASLQEMIEQPILKRRLWQFMQNIVN